ncbi:MAG: ATP-binding cassette domain-containing protein [Synergistaceae bacterium]|jgi:ABC-type glutathione transport system ATPase component|nr:ATP-binding cassette domain-containing protein [Synergistaceae bacterium]
MTSEKILEVKDLSVNFKGRGGYFGRRQEDVRALSSVSFSLAKGHTLAVIGESGSGKTTLMRSILGLMPAASGSVELFGRPVGEMRGEERLAARRRCGYVLQDPYSSLPPTLTVRDAVMEPWKVARGNGRETRAEAGERADAILSEMKLPEELWNARVRYSLSGGQRQRVAVARALILEPELLLCDEPTAMQDVSTRGEVLEVLRRRVERGMSMIIVTHDLLLARRGASSGIVLRKGEVVDEGETADLLEHPAHEYTKALVAALPKLR